MSSSRRQFLGLAPASLLLGGGLAQDGSGSAAERCATVVLLRHAEVDRDSGDDPHLSERGRRRAAALAELLGACGVTAVFATEMRRTAQSVEPLAQRIGVEVERYAAREPEGFVEWLTELPPGARVVVAGHSNTVPRMVALLGGELQGLDPRGFLAETEHDRVVVLTLFSADDTPMRAIQTLDLRLALAD